MLKCDELTFEKHIQERSASGLKALRALDRFVDWYQGCGQSVYLKLYRSLVLPVMHFGVQILAAVPENSLQCMEAVKRGAMFKASGCIHSTLEMLTNTIPLRTHIKRKQAEETVRIAKKSPEDPLKEDSNNTEDTDGKNNNVLNVNV